MRLTLSQIRTAVLEWIEQPSGQYWTPGGNFARLDQLINESYEEAVKHMESGNPFAWSAMPESAGATVTLAAETREYRLDDAMGNPLNIRKVIEVRQPPSGTVQSNPVPSVEYSQRDEARRGYAVYWFVSPVDGRWYLGLNHLSSPWTELLVLYRPALSPLAASGGVPVALPDEHHNVVVYGAAMRCLLIEGREAAGMAAMQARALDQLQKMTGPMASPFKSSRLG